MPSRQRTSENIIFSLVYCCNYSEFKVGDYFRLSYLDTTEPLLLIIQSKDESLHCTSKNLSLDHLDLDQSMDQYCIDLKAVVASMLQ